MDLSGKEGLRLLALLGWRPTKRVRFQTHPETLSMWEKNTNLIVRIQVEPPGQIHCGKPIKGSSQRIHLYGLAPALL